MKGVVANELATLALAIQFLTRIPIPVGDAYTPARLTNAARYYPLVGVLVGSVTALVYLLAALALPHSVSILLAVATGLLTTGAFHEDGLADTFDGLGAATPEQALDIMRDSRVGTYGALALVMALAIKVTILIELAPSLIVVTLIAAHGLSRLSAVLVIASSVYVRENGTGKPTAAGIAPVSLIVASITGVVLAAWVAWHLGFSAAASMLIFAAAGHGWMRSLFERRLGGYTGDTLGAVQQTSELGAYLGILLWHSS
ncbi:MAG: adenosylcobinamide-GDP ribazoletransferase [Pseudomonadota bacterium]